MSLQSKIENIIAELVLNLVGPAEPSDTDWADAVASDPTEPRTYEGD